jgi:hypothetical protein
MGIIEAIGTHNVMIIFVLLVVRFAPVVKNWADMRNGAHAVKKDRQSALFSALNSYLIGAPEYAPEFLNFQLEQTFQFYYKKRLMHHEIRKLATATDPSESIRAYLRTTPYLNLEIKSGVPGKFRFKEKPQRYHFRYKGKRLYKTSVHYLVLYAIFGVVGGFSLVSLATGAVKNGASIDATFIWQISLAVFSIMMAIGYLVAESKVDCARRFLLRKSPPPLTLVPKEDVILQNQTLIWRNKASRINA